MSHYRCTNPGYLLDGFCVQCLTSLGFDQFKELILFIRQILRVAHFNYKKYYNECIRCEKLIKNAKKRGVNIRMSKIKDGVSQSTKLRHCKRIDKSFEYHGECLQTSTTNMKDKWISYEHCRSHKIFDANSKLTAQKKRDFSKREKKLWQEYHNNKQRVTNLMLNAVNRRQSYRDIQSNRDAVSKFTHKQIFLNIYLTINKYF